MHPTQGHPQPRPHATTLLRDVWNEMISTGLFEVSAGERFVEHMIERIERRA
ncbi:hypothetical protein EV663_11842 [Rhodovulum bhavnagarense]|uniref:Uncharacterized protein n=1 Tax=Rhodovulum bhavnagarense TaxID=992286 RepID=A0A4R2R6N3_9RHOB|nr:hypothetical protein [Rhodovulum bhavnagarense]TCP58712.1 hypothetical protein EV663_11842 [Rhodovulum bhavnagarense]